MSIAGGRVCSFAVQTANISTNYLDRKPEDKRHAYQFVLRSTTADFNGFSFIVSYQKNKRSRKTVFVPVETQRIIWNLASPAQQHPVRITFLCNFFITNTVFIGNQAIRIQDLFCFYKCYIHNIY